MTKAKNILEKIAISPEYLARAYVNNFKRWSQIADKLPKSMSRTMMDSFSDKVQKAIFTPLVSMKGKNVETRFDNAVKGYMLQKLN